MSDNRNIIGLPFKILGNEQGVIKAMFEVFNNGDIMPIEHVAFNSSNEILVVDNYHSLLKSKSNIIMTACRLDDNGVYTSDIDDVKAVHKEILLEVFKVDELPNRLDMTLFCTKQPSTELICLISNDNIYGPFEWSEINKDENEYKISHCNTPLKNKLKPDGYVFFAESQDLRADIVNINIDGVDSTYLLKLDSLILNKGKKIDFLPINKILNEYGRKLLEKRSIKSQTKTLLTSISSEATKTDSARQHPERYALLSQIINQACEWDEIRTGYLSNFLKTKNGIQEVKEFIQENKDEYFLEYENDKLSKIDFELSKRHSDKNEYENQLDEIKKQIRQSRAIKNEIESNIEPTVNVFSSQHQEDIEKLKHEIEILKEKCQSVDDLESVKREIGYNNWLKDDINGQISALEKRKIELSSDVKDKTNELIQEMIRLKPTVDVLLGQFSNEVAKNIEYISNDIQELDDKSLIVKRDNYIETVRSNLSIIGRDLDFNDVANLIISIAQTQFVLFSGLPGVGKTSLVKKLGIALGLNNRCHTVSIAKGWMSQRDLIGYYNNLSQSWSSAPTGVYELLTQLSTEKDKSKVSPVIMLWDEINLSKVEHFASPFLEFSDVESSRELQLGDPKFPLITIPSYLRIIGTMNCDDSVSSLTPRLLDRSSVIYFDEPNNDWDWKEVTEQLSDFKSISAQDWTELFNCKPKLALEEKQLVEKISSILSDESPMLGNGIIISHRKRLLIGQYCAIASELMVDESDTLIALDYAVSQHIIPLLTGTGEGFGLRLNNLLDCLPSMVMHKTKKLLEKTIAQGKVDMHFYKPVGIA